MFLGKLQGCLPVQHWQGCSLILLAYGHAAPHGPLNYTRAQVRWTQSSRRVDSCLVCLRALQGCLPVETWQDCDQIVWGVAMQPSMVSFVRTLRHTEFVMPICMLPPSVNAAACLIKSKDASKA